VRPTKEEQIIKPLMPLGEGAIGIEFKEVRFAYAERNLPVLRNLNLKVS
jgi:ABC-type multidrug transport system fused ATPase/permease subunit